MGRQDDEIKIRTLPRKNESKGEPSTASKSTAKPAKAEAPASPRWIIYVGTVAVVLLLMVLFSAKPTRTKTKVVSQPLPPAIQSKDLSSISPDEINDAVTRHMQDSHMRRDMMEQASQIENSKVELSNLNADPYDVDVTANGVQLDQQEDAAARVFQDLNVNSAKTYADQTPDDKISARLANRQWVNELERRERITYVRNFIRSAYERGYEVQIDQDLRVVGVKKINVVRKFSIDQAIDKLASKQGF